MIAERAVRVVQPPSSGPVWSYRARLAVLAVTAVSALLVLTVGSSPEQLPMDPGTPPEVRLTGTTP